jgi:hypothetical protein
VRDANINKENAIVLQSGLLLRFAGCSGDAVYFEAHHEARGGGGVGGLTLSELWGGRASAEGQHTNQHAIIC